MLRDEDRKFAEAFLEECEKNRDWESRYSAGIVARRNDPLIVLIEYRFKRLRRSTAHAQSTSAILPAAAGREAAFIPLPPTGA